MQQLRQEGDARRDALPPGHVSEVGWEHGASGAPVRVLRDGRSGRKWRVWVADTRQVPGARADRCLLFDTGEWVRRVWRVPDDWGRMAPASLIALADGLADAPEAAVAARVPRRARPEGPGPTP